MVLVGMCASAPDFFYIFLMKNKHTGLESDKEVTITTRMLVKVLKRSDAVDKESPCILAGQPLGVCIPL
jgi:exosome complex RNA-binding protein Rrp42 (RNase PH superfamily)